MANSSSLIKQRTRKIYNINLINIITRLIKIMSKVKRWTEIFHITIDERF